MVDLNKHDEAYTKGREAQKAGLDLDDNPYREADQPTLAESWDDGWADADT